MSETLQGVAGGTAIAETVPELKAQIRELQRDHELVASAVQSAEERVALLKRQRRQLLELLGICFVDPLPSERQDSASKS
mmetsp:Transcript_4754/g.19025  ORF Transcript_4754/g.19025 Transcript_4754/m.19025 type:complete len:80 (-) Transcript_4754:1169-1408(-)